MFLLFFARLNLYTLVENSCLIPFRPDQLQELVDVVFVVHQWQRDQTSLRRANEIADRADGVPEVQKIRTPANNRAR